jgi:hypothetical protein
VLSQGLGCLELHPQRFFWALAKAAADVVQRQHHLLRLCVVVVEKICQEEERKEVR